jgi:hypothetical protein
MKSCPLIPGNRDRGDTLCATLIRLPFHEKRKVKRFEHSAARSGRASVTFRPSGIGFCRSSNPNGAGQDHLPSESELTTEGRGGQRRPEEGRGSVSPTPRSRSTAASAGRDAAEQAERGRRGRRGQNFRGPSDLCALLRPLCPLCPLGPVLRRPLTRSAYPQAGDDRICQALLAQRSFARSHALRQFAEGDGDGGRILDPGEVAGAGH